VAALQLARSSFPNRLLLATAKNLLEEACAHARCQALIPKELRLFENEMEQLHAEMRRLLRTSEREHLSDLMERAIALQAQIETMREQLKVTVPRVTAETVQSVAKRH
jgi:ATP-dependent Clp protease ATP-binding subunit ClpA